MPTPTGMQRRPPIGDQNSGMLVTFTMMLLVLEFFAALWIQGIIFAAALFGLMSLALAIATGGVYVLSRSANSASRYATARSLLLIALVSSASLALLAGLFALPLLFNGSRHPLRPEWRVPSILGVYKTHDAVTHVQSALFHEPGDSLKVSRIAWKVVGGWRNSI